MDFELLDSLIQSKKEQFWEMSDQIWGFAEMRFKEEKSSRLQMEFLRKEGFTVEEGTGCLEAAVAVKDYMMEHPGQGTIVYFGCPAEEGGA